MDNTKPKFMRSLFLRLGILLLLILPFYFCCEIETEKSIEKAQQKTKIKAASSPIVISTSIVEATSIDHFIQLVSQKQAAKVKVKKAKQVEIATKLATKYDGELTIINTNNDCTVNFKDFATNITYHCTSEDISGGGYVEASITTK